MYVWGPEEVMQIISLDYRVLLAKYVSHSFISHTANTRMAGFIIGSRLRMHFKMEVPFVHFVSLSVADKMTINAEYYIKTLRHNKKCISLEKIYKKLIKLEVDSEVI
jgi:hypothetical protein